MGELARKSGEVLLEPGTLCPVCQHEILDGEIITALKRTSNWTHVKCPYN